MKKNIAPFIVLGGMLLNGCFIRDLLFDPVDPRDKLKMSNLIDVAAKYNAESEVSNRTEKKKVADIYNEVYDKVEIKQFGENITYSKKLPAASTEARSIDQVSNIFDYYAFYGDGKPFEIKLPITNLNDAKKVINTAFYKSKLCASTTGLNYEYQEKGKKFVFQLLYNSDANSYKPKEINAKNMAIPYSFPTNNGNRAEDFAQYPYLTKNTKGEIDVYNSEQLFYALEYGYNPLPMKDSPAATLLDVCKGILKNIIKNDMTEKDKITAIYSYVISHTSYDYLSETNSTYTVEEAIFPDYLASSFRSYYAEGALIDGCANSHGYAKAFNLLANIEGITSLKVTSRFNDDTVGVNSTNYTDEGPVYSNIGYCYTYSSEEKKYFIVDPGYAMYTTTTISDNRYSLFRRPCIMYNFDNWSKIYGEITSRYNNTDYFGKDSLGTEQVSYATYFKIGSSLSHYVATVNNLTNYVRDLIAYVKANTDTTYKTNGAVYQVNLTIGEVETKLAENAEFFATESNVTSFENNITNKLNSYSSSIAYRSNISSYSSFDTGLILILKFPTN